MDGQDFTNLHSPSRTRRQLIIVDDERDILYVLKSSIEKNLECDVTVFSDPAEALDHFTRNSNACDLLISDVRMSVMSGFELVRRVREVKPDAKVMLMTAFEINKPEFEKMLPATRIDGFIQKPGTVKSICAAIERCLED